MHKDYEMRNFYIFHKKKVSISEKCLTYFLKDQFIFSSKIDWENSIAAIKRHFYLNFLKHSEMSERNTINTIWKWDRHLKRLIFFNDYPTTLSRLSALCIVIIFKFIFIAYRAITRREARWEFFLRAKVFSNEQVEKEEEEEVDKKNFFMNSDFYCSEQHSTAHIAVNLSKNFCVAKWVENFQNFAKTHLDVKCKWQ